MALFSLPGCLTALAAILTFSVWRILYNLYFHPLSHFPGPKIAACSRLWLAYREVIKGESLSDLRVELHQKYGEIVRLTPNELHFSNPAAYNDIYNNRNKWDKDHLLYDAFDQYTSSLGSIHYSDAKQRRDIIAPFFSRASIIQMQDLIQERVNVLCDALARQFAAGDTIRKSSDLVLGFHCFGVDVIMAFCYAKNLDATKVPDFRSDIVLASEMAVPIITIRKYSSTLVKMMRYIPMWYGKNFGSPMTRALFLLHKTLMDPIDEILRAGSDTVTVAATTISYHVLHNPDVQQRLVNELRTAWPVLEEVPRYEVFEKLPLRLSKRGFAYFQEAQRYHVLSPQKVRLIGGTFVPGGTVVGQWLLSVLRSPTVFPNPDVFIPERWLGENAKILEGSLVVFSKGPRSCIAVA
ncbi:putative P450 monooxygenase [Lactarius sanguifluus]|nr:putative P450 monooxygenase [Lactarius sanguifluus]